MNDVARTSGVRPTRILSVRAVTALLPEIISVAVFIVAIWAALYLALAREYRSAEQEALQTNASLAHAYADNAQRLVVGIDQLLLALRTSFADSPDKFDVVSWSRLQNPADRLRVQIGVIGADGQLRASTRQTVQAGVDLSDREHFRAQLDPERDDIFVSKPVTGRVTGKQTIQFSRKLLHADGSFAGVGVVSVGCEELARFYEQLDLNGFVTMVGSDGIVRARGPLAEGSVGLDLRADPEFSPVFQSLHGHGAISITSDGRAYVVGFKRLEDYPLIVLVGADRTAAFAGFQAMRDRTLVMGMFVTLVTGLLGLFWVVQRGTSASFQRNLAVTLDSVSQGIIMIDDRGRIPVINQRAAELLDLPPGITDRPVHRTLERLGAKVALTTGAPRVLVQGDKLIEMQARATPEGGVVLTYSDVTERARHEAQMSQLAHHDRLTGLANRVLLDKTIQDALQRAKATDGRMGLIAIDLDNFKMVNDDYGHEFGDMLLVETASRLTRSVRSSDVVARIGGDEFIVLIDGSASEQACEQIMQQLVAVLAAPVQIDGHSISSGASAGLAVFPVDGECQRSLLRHADRALYEAKAAGRGTSRRFCASMLERLSERRWLESELRSGLERGDLTVHYQPQFDPRTLAVTGFEALARWRHPERGFISPALFIPVAEECGLVTEIGTQVLEQACSLAASLPQPCRVAVNLSPIQFRDAGLTKLVVETLARTRLPANLLELEVTEGVLIHDESQALQILAELRSLGVRIALDDFGTGYSSLNYLRRFPFDRVKIDKSFVQAQDDDERSTAILDTVLTLSGRLHLSVTAEGVETESQLQTLRAKGVGEVQGFLLGRPMPGTDVRRFLTTTQASTRLLSGSSDDVASGRSTGATV